ncbi:MAG: hypothetical protein IIZ78_20215 [Clostridiales bacterium]|nr:hypothetical protein [Clostridiales bacterium]
MNWKKWTAIGLTAAVVIALVVLHFVQPEVSYAFVEAASAVSFVAGAVAGYLYKKYRVEKKQDTKTVNE